MSTAIRNAGPGDADRIFELICDLARYEREPDAVVTSPEKLRAQLASDKPPFECVLAEIDGAVVGMALFFHNYSTWKGERGLYLEDLFVTEAARGKGAGKALLVHLAQLAVQRGCARFEWCVVDWNQPAIEFYQALGAKPLQGWTIYRLSGDALAKLGSSAPVTA